MHATARSARSAPGLGSTDIAACLASGEFWQAVPGTIQVEFTGEKGRFVTGKDLILAVIAEIGVAGGTNMVLEFVGAGAEALSIDERLAVANMAVEAGSETGFFPADETVAAYLEGRTDAALDGRAHRRRRRVRAARARSTSTRSRRSSPLPHSPGQRRAARRGASGARSTRSTSATARTGR